MDGSNVKKFGSATPLPATAFEMGKLRKKLEQLEAEFAALGGEGEELPEDGKKALAVVDSKLKATMADVSALKEVVSDLKKATDENTQKLDQLIEDLSSEDEETTAPEKEQSKKTVSKKETK